MLAARFCEDFAETMARRVLEADAVATLYAVATGPAGSLPQPRPSRQHAACSRALQGTRAQARRQRKPPAKCKEMLNLSCHARARPDGRSR